MGRHILNTLGRGAQIPLRKVDAQCLHAVNKIRRESMAALPTAHVDTNGSRRNASLSRSTVSMRQCRPGIARPFAVRKLTSRSVAQPAAGLYHPMLQPKWGRRERAKRFRQRIAVTCWDHQTAFSDHLCQRTAIARHQGESRRPSPPPQANRSPHKERGQPLPRSQHIGG
ncbi:MAG: hypothetical protein CM15mP25_0630 [Gammaproteobacteria bacterium]|nr:MAG: hypothetical protein CM15mP25_0630 [Gammaproteobacteria bacterium]